MGNEQSASAGPSTSQSSFSFLSSRASVKKSGKGIVTVRDGSVKVSTVEEDEVYKRYVEIPKFLPILPTSIGKKGQREQQQDNQMRMSSRPILKFYLRFHEHLTICGRYITTDQAHLMDGIKRIDKSSVTLATSLTEKKKAHSKFLEELRHLPSLNDELMRIQILLEELVPVAETLNELLVPSDRLPELNLGKVLQRTPVSSTESSLHSTPRRGRGVPGIEEITVVDKD